MNLEYLASVVFTGAGKTVYPDTLVGTDSHTTMINGLGVLGWGVGGIEAEAALLGQPQSMLIPDVIGMKLVGTLPPGATATDLVLTVTQMLRKKGVVGKFVEFYGPGVGALALTDRATIANMAPEYGATMGFFPVDAETIKYLKFTNRPAKTVALAEAYCKKQGLFRTKDSPDPVFTDTLTLNLKDVEPSLAGPKRPQDRVPLKDSKKIFRESLKSFLEKECANVDPKVIGRWLAKEATAGWRPVPAMRRRRPPQRPQLHPQRTLLLLPLPLLPSAPLRRLRPSGTAASRTTSRRERSSSRPSRPARTPRIPPSCWAPASSRRRPSNAGSR